MSVLSWSEEWVFVFVISNSRLIFLWLLRIARGTFLLRIDNSTVLFFRLELMYHHYVTYEPTKRN
jgi:hypothetical protein